MLGPEEFFEGLGIGLKSFFGAGVVGKNLASVINDVNKCMGKRDLDLPNLNQNRCASNLFFPVQSKASWLNHLVSTP